MPKPAIGTPGHVKFTHGTTAGVVSDHADGDRDIVVTLFCNAASSAEGIDGPVAQYPTKVGDQVSDFTPAA
jgi:hypothetical protein